MKRFIALLSAALLGAALLCGCAATQQEEYTPATKKPMVSSPDLATDGVLRVGVDTSQGKAPLAGIGSNGSPVGIDVDFAAWIADDLGLKLEIIDVAGDPITALQTGAVDVVMGYSADDKNPTLWKSRVYLPTGVVLFATSASAPVPEDDSNPQISAEAAKKSAWAVVNEFGAEALVAGADMSEVFEMLRDSAVEYAAADALIGLYAANTVNCNASVVALMEAPTGYCVITLQEKVGLQTALDATLQRLCSNGILSRMVETKWLGKSYTLDGVAYTPLAALTQQVNNPDEGSDEGEGEEGEGEEGEGGEGTE